MSNGSKLTTALLRGGIVWLSILSTAQLRSEEPFHVWNEEIPGGFRFFVRSPDAIPRSVQLSFSSFQNLEASKELPLQFVVDAAAEKLAILDLKIVEPKKGHRFRFQSAFHVGDYRSAKHDDSAVYWLPFEHGTKHRIYQGYNGKASHSDEGKEFALDFRMDEGTKITAARAGTAVAVKEDSDRGGWSKSFEDHSNHVHILHEDGSIAKYEHLSKEGVLIELGDKVEAGEEIGLSGNTGRSSGAHLHFEVVVPTAIGKGASLPTKFVDHLGKAVAPVAGELYYAFHPGKPPFEAIFPVPPTNADYAKHRADAPENNKITAREETVDTTTVLFLRNGFPVAKTVNLTMPQIQNLKMSKPVPMTLTVAPLTEIFVLLMTPEDLALPTRYRANWKWEDASP